MRVMMVVASAVSYFINDAMAKGEVQNREQDGFRKTADFAGMDHFHRVGGVDVCIVEIDDSGTGWRFSMWWKLSFVITCGTCRRSADSRVRESVYVHHVAACARSGLVVARRRPSLNILSGLVAAISARTGWDLAILLLMTGAYYVSTFFPESMMSGAGRVCFRTGGVRISGNGTGDDRVDSYGR
jgi:K(+)-stimulated pyrophosphate-energized sodium pump